MKNLGGKRSTSRNGDSRLGKKEKKKHRGELIERAIVTRAFFLDGNSNSDVQSARNKKTVICETSGFDRPFGGRFYFYGSIRVRTRCRLPKQILISSIRVRERNET